MVCEVIYREYIIKHSGNQVLIQVTNDEDVVAGVLLHKSIKISVMELYGLSSLPHAHKGGAMLLCPYIENHHLKVGRESHIKGSYGMILQILFKTDSDTAEGPA